MENSCKGPVHSSTHMPYQVSTLWTLWFLRYKPKKIFKLKVATASSKVNQGHTMTLPTSTLPPRMSQPSINILHFTVSEIQPRQAFFSLPIRLTIQMPWVKQYPTALWGKNKFFTCEF